MDLWLGGEQRVAIAVGWCVEVYLAGVAPEKGTVSVGSRALGHGALCILKVCVANLLGVSFDSCFSFTELFGRY